MKIKDFFNIITQGFNKLITLYLKQTDNIQNIIANIITLISAIILIMLLFCVTASTADASESRHDYHKIYNTLDSGCDPVANAGNEIHFDSSTDDLQLGLGFATCEHREGGKISLGQRFCSDCPLINGSIGKENDKDAYYGLGFNWKFK